MNRYSNRNPRRGSSRNPYSSNFRDEENYTPRNKRITPADPGEKINFSTGTIAVLAGVLILGVGIGSAITSTTDGGQGNIASQQQLDMAVPDPEFCRQWGASAFVIDVEMYTTLNPSTSFVTQPALQPGDAEGNDPGRRRTPAPRRAAGRPRHRRQPRRLILRRTRHRPDEGPRNGPLQNRHRETPAAFDQAGAGPEGNHESGEGCALNKAGRVTSLLV